MFTRKWQQLRWVRYVALAPLLLLLNGCATHSIWWIFDPRGVGAKASFDYMMIDVVVMLGIVGLTGIMIVWFMWRYHKGKNRGTYDGKWAHSTTIEVFVWGIPIVAVGFLSWAVAINGSFAVNPYNPTVITRHMKPHGKPIEVDVIATDWQWLFIYPQYHMAVANELVVPAHTPVFFKLTSTAVTTDFFVPQLLGMIDVMPGMRTKDALESDSIGQYQGVAADYCGAGTSWMLFKTHVLSKDDFASWVHHAQQSTGNLSIAGFNQFAEPYININNKIEYFSRVQKGLFNQVILEVMHGRKWPLPMFMTENMVGYLKKQAAEHRA